MGDTNPPLPYGKPFDKTSAAYKAFAAKRRFTLDEFACLLAGIDPRTFDGTLESNCVKAEKIDSFVRLLEEDIQEKPRWGEDDVPF